MNLHNVLLEMAKKHQKIKGGGFSDLLYFNHKKKRISNGKTVLVDEGKIIPQTIKLTDCELVLDDDWGEINENFYTGIEKRYEQYYKSLPSKVEQYVKSIFITKAMNKYSSFEEMMNVNCNRELARYELEWFLMASSIKGNITWENEKHWFWQSKNNPKLIIKREYI